MIALQVARMVTNFCLFLDLSDEDILKDLIDGWNDDECYVRLGADQRTVESRACFEVTIIER